MSIVASNNHLYFRIEEITGELCAKELPLAGSWLITFSVGHRVAALGDGLVHPHPAGSELL
jgi:hypothetical protein